VQTRGAKSVMIITVPLPPYISAVGKVLTDHIASKELIEIETYQFAGANTPRERLYRSRHRDAEA
jgi:hypothetical protein